MKKLLLVLSAYMASIPLIAGAEDFPADAGIDVTESRGKFAIRLDGRIGQLLGIQGCPFNDACLIDSPALYDPDTRIGRSKPHKHGDLVDRFDAQVLIGESPDVWGRVRDGDFSIIPDTPMFESGPPGTKEVHTEIVSVNMQDPRGSANAIKIGQAVDEDVFLPQNSIGEVESGNTAAGDFPAESFFNLFVQVDFDLGSGQVMTLFNPDPLLIQNSNLNKFPPEVLYVHGVTESAVPVHQWDITKFDGVGQRMGWIVLAGHGVGYVEINPQAAPAFTDGISSDSISSGEERFLEDYQREVVEKGEMPIPSECGPGEHWVNGCRGSFDDLQTNASLSIAMSPCSSPVLPVKKMRLNGPTKVARWNSSESNTPQPHTIETEIVSIFLEGNGIILRAGDAYANISNQDGPQIDGSRPHLHSPGKITEDENEPTKANSYFNVNFEIEGNFGKNDSLVVLHGEEACLMKAEIDRVPPVNDFECENVPMNLLDENDNPVACLAKAIHGLPVTITIFNMEVTDGELIVDWTTETEVNNVGFSIWEGKPLNGKCTANISDYEQVGSLIPSEGNGKLGAEYGPYVYEVSDLTPGEIYCFALVSVDKRGKLEIPDEGIQKVVIP